MKKKALWLGLSLLLVAALVLTSCAEEVAQTAPTTPTTPTAPTAPTTPTTPTTPTAPVAGEPVYGGTLTFFHRCSATIPTSWDRTTTLGGAAKAFTCPYAEFLLVGDIDKYGPRGTGEFPFTFNEYVPIEYLTGYVAESWELKTEPVQIIFHIRPGIMWTGREGVMEAREFTAEDAAFSVWRYWKAFRAGTAYDFVTSMVAEGRYTFVVNCWKYNYNWPYYIAYGSRCDLYPPEVVAAGGDDWKNQVGTGPFILEQYVSASEAVYVKNPDYWGTTTINGKEYQLPFVDKLVYPVIVDSSTQIAALRTGKLDFHIMVPLTYEDTLKQTNPELIQFKYLRGSVTDLRFQCVTSEIFSKRDVRRALRVGTDLDYIRTAVYVDGVVHGYPIAPGLPYYTPLEELPESTRILYEYDAVKAKQMLADAGYPTGFSMELVYNARSAEVVDVAAMLVDMWKKLGVTVTLTPLEGAAYTSVEQGHTYKDACMGYTATTINPSVSLQQTALWGTQAVAYKDDWYTATYQQAFATMDEAERTRLCKELAVYMLDDAATIPLTNPYILCCYWPWVKNYYGETEIGHYQYTPIVSRIWIDQDLKEALGYK